MNKEEKYRALLPQVRALVEGETDEVARMANVAALLHEEFGFWWTGFYRVIGDCRREGGPGDCQLGNGIPENVPLAEPKVSPELVLGPFQGPVACTRIAFGRGVCGTAWAERRTVVVPDVEQFPGHIACSALSRSEIVVPVWKGDVIAGVLDIDSRELGTFDETDRVWLEKVAALVYGDAEREIWFAAGCFWGAQKFFKLVDGVVRTETGFANGLVEHPSYRQVYTDQTGHAECVHVRYDPARVSLRSLAELYFQIIDPLSLNKQGEDVGTRYRTGVYYEDEADAEILREVFRTEEQRLGVSRLAVELGPLKSFYPAEEYHQDYLDKHPDGYCHLTPAHFALARQNKK